MQNTPSQQFEKMNLLSTRKEAFFFVINFLGTEVRLFTTDELNSADINIDFPNFKKHTHQNPIQKNFSFQSFPTTLEEYKKGFDIVQNNLKLGNSYLTNYTTKTPIQTSLDLLDIFNFSKAKYKLFYQNQFVVFSPETFIEIKENIISTHPMKGTIDASIENAPEVLKNDIKEKAEHYTVVDLLRNDLSMVADNVHVDEFQRIDFIKTPQKNLYAMSSEISGKIKPEFEGKIGSILQKLIPAGSILGAPKPKTLEIILNAEDYDRGFYTGICGYFDGKNLDSCVMIRFIEEEDGNLYFKSGGGITHLSKLEDEYQEMKNKIYVPIY